MEKKRMIPEDFMTVGQLAQKMGTTVRTLQYYDREGLLTPSAQSEGGRRLYTYKDMIRLHQIQSLKSWDFLWTRLKTGWFLWRRRRRWPRPWPIRQRPSGRR